MLPSAFTLRNYRCYPGPVRFELRPLTLIYGANSAGKSALLRTLPLIADSCLHDGLDALHTGRRLKSFELDFDSLRRRGRAETDEHTLGIGIHWDDDVLSAIEWDFWEHDDWHRILVHNMRVYGAGRKSLLDVEWKRTRDEARSLALSYRRDPLDDDTVIPIEFRGLIPTLDANTPEHVVPIAQRLRELSSAVTWLHSLRPAPARYTRWTGGVRWSLEPDGRDAPIVLAGEPSVRERVSAWYRQHVGVQLVLEETRAREVRVQVSYQTQSRFNVDLIDTGEGLSQVLPVLTAVEMAREHASRGGPGIVAIEEPEAHLHTNLQTALAQRICDVVADTRPRIVLETHSELFLLAIQLQVLRGVVSPDDVGIYWVRQEHGVGRAQLIELDGLARLPTAWPPDAFRDALALAADIHDERDTREPA